MAQPHKGNRRARTIRFPMPLNSKLEQAAAEAGYGNVNDYVVAVVAAAQDAGLWPADAGQQHLPIGA